MGPLSKMWTAVELARLSQQDSVEVNFKRNSGACGTNCIADGTSNEFHILL